MFSEQVRQEMSQAIEANYEEIRSIILEQEKSKDKCKPTLLELGNISCSCIKETEYNKSRYF
jgi:hypothetical protein